MTKPEKHFIEPFEIIGISTRTLNTSGNAAADLGALWGRFFEEQIGTKVTRKSGKRMRNWKENIMRILKFIALNHSKGIIPRLVFLSQSNKDSCHFIR